MYHISSSMEPNSVPETITSTFLLFIYTYSAGMGESNEVTWIGLRLVGERI